MKNGSVILYRSTGDKEGEVFQNFELFPYFSIDVQPELANNNFIDENESLLNFIEEMQMTTV